MPRPESGPVRNRIGSPDLNLLDLDDVFLELFDLLLQCPVVVSYLVEAVLGPVILSQLNHRCLALGAVLGHLDAVSQMLFQLL